jgi:hypothetical protein
MRKYLFLLVVIFFVLSNKAIAQTKEFSWVYLYYTNSFGARPTFTVLFNDKEVIQLEKRARVKCKVYSTGNINISCFYGSKNEKFAESFVTLNVQQGKAYYVKLDNTYLKLRLVDEITGEKEFNNPKLAKIQDFREDIQDPFIKKDNGLATKVEKQIVKSDVDVDNDIPITSETRSNTYALIIGNEDYSSFQTGLSTEVNVDFALNDAKVFKEYCTKTLGIPEKQVKLLPNATAGQMSQGLAWLSNLARVDNGKAELVFYYSGHGLPDEQTKEPYLIPVDISGNNVTLAIKLSDVYAKLNEYPSKKISVFLDACFSGGARNQGLIAMKGVKVKPKEDMITGNMVVLSSSTGEESSGVYREKQHGYMTYFLLKKLQETKGDITYKDLADYVVESVKKETALEGKIQTPQCNYSPSIENIWLNWRMK